MSEDDDRAARLGRIARLQGPRPEGGGLDGGTRPRRGRWAVVPRVVAGLALIAAVGGLAGFIFYRPDRLNPTTEPAEANRIHNPRGFSIVAPPGWANANEADPSRGTIHAYLKTTPDQPRGSARAYLTVIDHGEHSPFPDDRRFLERTTFQGQPAFRMQEPPGSRYPAYRRALYFLRAGYWFSITYQVSTAPSVAPPAIVDRYLDTFQLDRPRQPLPVEMRAWGQDTPTFDP